MKKVISLILLCCSFMACDSTRSLSPREYIQYIEDPKNPYSVRQEIGEHEYTIQLAPAAYMALKELEESDSLAAAYPKRLQELQGYVFFLIKIGTTEASRVAQGGKRTAEQQLNVDRMVSYYDQQAILDISLLQGSHTLKPVTYVFENNYELAPYNTIVVGFEQTGNGEDLSLNFNDRYTQVPAIRATFSQASISKMPQIKIKK